VTYSRAKVQGQRSVGSEDRVETNKRTDGQTDVGDCSTSYANEFSNKRMYCTEDLFMHIEKSDMHVKHHFSTPRRQRQ